MDRLTVLELCFELAGVAGVNPLPFTLAELLSLAEGRERSEWKRTAELCHLIANANRDRETKPEPFTPADFFPFDKPQKPQATVEQMRQSFLGW